MTVRKINFYLGTLRLTPEHQRLFSYMDELTAMQQAFLKIAPPQLAQRCALGGFFEGNLTIYARKRCNCSKTQTNVAVVIIKISSEGL